MNLPIEFAFGNEPVRVLMLEGNPWWVAADVAEVLEYPSAGQMTRNLDDDEKGVHNMHTLGGDQQMVIINESGLFSVILRSRKASAKKFRKWVTSEVLPSLRKHGAYVMPQVAEAIKDPDTTEDPRQLANRLMHTGRAFGALFRTARQMGMNRSLASTRANAAARRATGIDMAAELGATDMLEWLDMSTAQRHIYELQQRIRAHLVANDWPQPITTDQLIQALQLPSDRATKMKIGDSMLLLNYRRVRLSPQPGTGARPWAYVMV